MHLGSLVSLGSLGRRGFGRARDHRTTVACLLAIDLPFPSHLHPKGQFTTPILDGLFIHPSPLTTRISRASSSPHLVNISFYTTFVPHRPSVDRRVIVSTLRPRRHLSDLSSPSCPSPIVPVAASRLRHTYLFQDAINTQPHAIICANRPQSLSLDQSTQLACCACFSSQRLHLATGSI